MMNEGSGRRGPAEQSEFPRGRGRPPARADKLPGWLARARDVLLQLQLKTRSRCKSSKSCAQLGYLQITP